MRIKIQAYQFFWFLLPGLIFAFPAGLRTLGFLPHVKDPPAYSSTDKVGLSLSLNILNKNKI